MPRSGKNISIPERNPFEKPLTKERRDGNSTVQTGKPRQKKGNTMSQKKNTAPSKESSSMTAIIAVILALAAIIVGVGIFWPFN